jgi:hypothetical protein
MDNTRLHDGLLPHGVDRVRQSLQSVADHHQHVPGAAVLDFRADPHPVLGPFPVAVLPGPQAQHVPLAVCGDAQGEIDRTVGDLALADLDVDRVDEDHRVNGVQWPGSAIPPGRPSPGR